MTSPRWGGGGGVFDCNTFPGRKEFTTKSINSLLHDLEHNIIARGKET